MYTEILLIIVSVLLLVVIIKLFWPRKKENDDASKLLFEQLENVRRAVEEKHDKLDEKMTKNIASQSEVLQRQFANSAKIITEVTQKLTKLDETNKQVVGFAEQLQSLENILKNPKQRGILGEYFLETLLANVLQPTQYQMQYRFQNGEAVDAVVFMKDKVIPIDAKFSLEKYNKIMGEKTGEGREKLEKEFKMDIKNRIDETAKYIRPEENTTDFALMFIPAEGIYYNMLIYKVGATGVNATDLVEYAFKKRVIIVSPTSFFAYLQTILHGLKALQMEESVKEIVKNVGQLGKHLGAYEEYFDKVGKHLGTTVNAYNSAYKELSKVDKDVVKITGEGSGVEVKLVDKPGVD